MVQPFEEQRMQTTRYFSANQTISLIAIESKLPEGFEEALQSSLDSICFPHLHTLSAL